MNRDFNIDDYHYNLPEEQIAKYPMKERSKSKLLIWDKGNITHEIFENATRYIPPNSLLVFNDTKVIAARILFLKETGAQIEIFLLHPELPTRDISESMSLQNQCTWVCMIGNKKKWKEGIIKNNTTPNNLVAKFHNRDKNLVTFCWDGDDSFAEIINKAGETPLPPYLKRKAESSDANRYQTIYSINDGAVAAPTAGLHFTKAILDQFDSKNISSEYLTLHVSAGTFKPVEAKDFREHKMHCEQIVINKNSLDNLIKNHNSIISVGTTSLRILESLYWYGVLLSSDKNAKFFINKNLPYSNRTPNNLIFENALKNIKNHMEENSMDELHGETEIFIYPGYALKSVKGIFTNFHLPKSTLLLLVSTFTEGSWKNIYHAALDHNYRFLSYGDSSLLLK